MEATLRLKRPFSLHRYRPEEGAGLSLVSLAPLIAQVGETTDRTIAVAELSSFQLELIDTFRPNIAVFLNLTPDHLDRHKTLTAYGAAKARIFENQTSEDFAILNADDAESTKYAPPLPWSYWFSRKTNVEQGAFVREGKIIFRQAGKDDEILYCREIPLPGAHNLENVLAATACALWTGMAPAAIRTAVARFRGVAHRIEWVRDLRGVQYFNDSKGTNVASTLKALESFPGRIVLIAGGKGKGQAWEPLADAARGRVIHTVLIGEDARKIGAALAAASIPLTYCDSMQAAIDRATAVATPGDVVLLSPACASFDMFDNFEHRGDVFKKLVERLD